ncbi:hypothetical protein VNI00_010238 [Paramarasmius palmivorus]|uniref:Uncharacterized protein n=1 Tax=Paramarasmius palmivorus TaxID=297713 RepID=A0AAW0CH86_9AGAR
MLLPIMLLLIPALGAEVLEPPPTRWNSSVAHYEERLEVATNALLKGFSMLNSEGRVELPPNDRSELDKTFALYSALAEFDAATNSSDYASFTTRLLKIGFDCPGCTEQVNDFNLECDQLGYAVYKGYATYKDQELLDMSKEYWYEANNHTVNNSGVQPRKNFSVVEACEELLSALLATTEGGMYMTAAQQSGDFLEAALQAVRSIRYGVDSDSEEEPMQIDSPKCVIPSLTGAVQLSVNGHLIEGLSTIVLATDNSSTLERLENRIFSLLSEEQDPRGIVPTFWSDTTGVLLDPCAHIKADPFVLRGLIAAAKIPNLRPDLYTFIKAFFAVQYNAVRNAVGDDNIYGCDWGKGNALASSYEATNQTQALQVLIDGINFFNETRQPTTSSTMTQSPATSTGANNSSSHSKKTSAAIIAGSMVGGVALLVLLVMFYVLRRRQRNASSSASRLKPFFSEPKIEVTPFVWDPSDLASEPVRTKSYPITRTRTSYMPSTRRDEPPQTIPEHSQDLSPKLGQRVRVSTPNSLRTHAPSESETLTVVNRRPTDIMMPMGTSLPEMIRELYFRLWEQEGENSSINSTDDHGDSR